MLNVVLSPKEMDEKYASNTSPPTANIFPISVQMKHFGLIIPIY